MRISDWSSDVCSSDLQHPLQVKKGGGNLLSTLLIECGEWHSRMRWTLSGELRSRFRTLIHLLHQWWISRFAAGFRQSIVGQRSKEGGPPSVDGPVPAHDPNREWTFLDTTVSLRRCHSL